MQHPINITDTLQLGWVIGKIYVTLTVVLFEKCHWNYMIFWNIYEQLCAVQDDILY